MIGAGEAAPAVVALEGLGSRVFPKVAGEFVGASEPPLTAFPRTPVRLLACGQGKKGTLEETKATSHLSRKRKRGELKADKKGG